MSDVRERHVAKASHYWKSDFCIWCNRPWPCDAIREAERADAAEADAERLAEALLGVKEGITTDGLPCWCIGYHDESDYCENARAALAAHEARVSDEY